MHIAHLYHSVTAIMLPLSGSVAPSEYLPAMATDYPHGLIVRVDSGGRVIEPVYAWGWSLSPLNAQAQTADVNHDGFVTGDDADLFRARFEAGDITADYDGDGFVTGEDFDSFQRDFEAGSARR